MHNTVKQKLKKISIRDILVVSNSNKLWFTNERSNEYKLSLIKLIAGSKQKMRMSTV